MWLQMFVVARLGVIRKTLLTRPLVRTMSFPSADSSTFETKELPSISQSFDCLGVGWRAASAFMMVASVAQRVIASTVIPLSIPF